jgi:hypothetical protein
MREGAGAQGVDVHFQRSWRGVLPSLHFRSRRIPLLGLILVIVAGAGCFVARHATSPIESLPDVASGVDGAKAHIDSAERANVAAKPLAGTDARPLLDFVSDEHRAAGDALHDAQAALVKARVQANAIAGDNVRLAGELVRVTSGWGYRLQVTVARIAWLLIGAEALHIVLGAASLFVAGPSGAILARIGLYLNPLAWFQSARDNYWFRKKAGARK